MLTRKESDYIGTVEIPHDAYWGIHTHRAFLNFKISSYTVPQKLITAYSYVKEACALTNKELGYLDHHISDLIITVCHEIRDGKLSDAFPLDALQGGAGTSLNMNINEVIANRANQIAGSALGSYFPIHPLHHVNLNQSTNDTYPTALKIAIFYDLKQLSTHIEAVQQSLQYKEKEFANILMIGRTEMQDAVPMTLGTQFSSFAEAIARDRWRTFKCQERIRTVNIGGTAIGTGLAAPRDYIFLVIEKIRELTGLGVSRAENMVDQTANTDMFVEISGILKAHASNLIKIANDLRMLHYFNEIKLPHTQVGSSIMPGKINPVISEAIIQAGIKVIANDFIVTETTSRSTFQINEYMPLLAFSILESLEILININKIFSKHINEITANGIECERKAYKSTTLLTAFLPYISYTTASDYITEFEHSNFSNIKEFLYTKIDKTLVEQVLNPDNITAMGYTKNE
jgi:aspartate ammonia-lyase